MACAVPLLRRHAARLVTLLQREPSTILALAAAIGLGVGLVVVAFYRAIDLIQRLALGGATRADLPIVAVIPLLVALGFVASRALVRWGAGGSPGENIADVMHAIAVRGGKVAPLPVAVKTVASALVIGTGGSVGPEGPVVVAGAAAGSRIGRWFHATPERLKTLVGAGAAAGVAAAFNAPIAGVLFVVEKMLGAFGASALAPVVVAAVLASVVGRAAFGDEPVIAVPTEYTVGTAPEIALYALLGVVTGVVSVLYTRGVHRSDAWLRGFPRPWLAAGLATAGVAALDLAFGADLWGRGHETLDLAIVVQRAPWFLIALAFAKLVATALSLAAARVGGVFTPALFIGGTLGGGLGLWASGLLPTLHLHPQAFALVGMAGIVAGSTHAPLTAMMMVFEMTGDYGLILPLMLCAALSFLVARRLHPESIYTEWLARRGVHLSHGADAALLARLAVADCVDRKCPVLREDATLGEILAALRRGRLTDVPVVDGDGRLLGVVSAFDLRELLEQESSLAQLVLAGDVVRDAGDMLTPDDSLLTALRRFGAGAAPALPVVDSRRSRRVLGVLTRADLFATYERGLAEAAL
jgi:CIC family chloride channel protein